MHNLYTLSIRRHHASINVVGLKRLQAGCNECEAVRSQNFKQLDLNIFSTVTRNIEVIHLRESASQTSLLFNSLEHGHNKFAVVLSKKKIQQTISLKYKPCNNFSLIQFSASDSTLLCCNICNMQWESMLKCVI